jgi:hypothetical protein
MPFDGTNFEKPLRTRFIEALRSGTYTQTRGHWKNGDSVCAMGVLMSMVNPDFKDPHSGEEGSTDFFKTLNKTKEAIPDMERHAIIWANDTKKLTFEQIADKIEDGTLVKEYEPIFQKQLYDRMMRERAEREALRLIRGYHSDYIPISQLRGRGAQIGCYGGKYKGDKEKIKIEGLKASYVSIDEIDATWPVVYKGEWQDDSKFNEAIIEFNPCKELVDA